MKFNTSLHELDKHIGQTLAALERSEKLYDQEGIVDVELRGKLDSVGEQLTLLRAALAAELAAHEATYELIRYLNDALRLEYQHILEYERYADVVQDERLADQLQTFGSDERQHAHALSMKIIELGGSPHFSAEHEIRDDMTVFDLLSRLRITEQQLVDHYSSGIQRFDDPSAHWLIGRLKVEEEEHIRLIDTLLEMYRDQAIMVEESRNFTWIDPYMGKPGDRAWIE